MKIINWIKSLFWNIIAWFVLRDGHTTHHYKMSDKNIITNASGHVTTWKDSSGHGNDAKVYPNDGVEIIEIISRNGVEIIEIISRNQADGKFKSH